MPWGSLQIISSHMNPLRVRNSRFMSHSEGPAESPCNDGLLFSECLGGS